MIRVILVTTLAAFFCAALWRMYRRNHLQTKLGRAGLLDQCAGLLENPVLTTSHAGFAALSGLYQGYETQLTLEEDHVAARKIPSLWLHVAVSGRSETNGTVDMLMRPQNTEFYSPSWDWDYTVSPLPEWPLHAIYRTSDAPPNLQVLDHAVRRVFTDEKAKELLVLPRMVRLTWQAKQAERGDYLLLRSASFDTTPLLSEQVADLLQQAFEIRRNLEGIKAS